MRVALSVTEFPAVSQTFVLDHAVGLLRRGHAVEIHALKRGSATAAHAEIESLGLGNHSHYAPVLPTVRSRAGSAVALLRHFGPGLIARPRLALSLVRSRGESRMNLLQGSHSFWARGGTVDLVHAHSGQNGRRLLPLYAAGLLRAPLVVTFHGHDVHGHLHGRAPDYYQSLFAQAAALVVCSEFMRERLRDLGAPAAKLSLIPNGIDPASIPYQPRPAAPGRRTLLSIGRLVPFKGLENLIAALAHPALRGTDLHLQIVGDGPLRERLQAQVSELGLAGRVDFLGARNRDAVQALLASADLYVAPAVIDAEGNTETQGVALLEAMASGLPVIASAVGGIPETLGDAAAALVKPGDPPALAEAIARWLRGELAPDDGRGRRRVERHFGREAWLDTLESLYARIRK